MHHTSSEEDSSPDCSPADLNAPICVFYFSHPYGVGSPHETARPTVRSNVTKRPGAARPRGRRKPEVPPRKRKKRPDIRWRRFMRRPIHHLRSFLFVREQDLTGPSKFESPLPDLNEVLRIVRQAWLSPRSCSLASRCPTSNRNQIEEEQRGMGTGPRDGRALPHRRYSVPETVMRRYVLSKQRSAGSSDSGVATVPPASPQTNTSSTSSSRSSVQKMGHSLDSSDGGGPGPNNSKDMNTHNLTSKNHNDKRISNAGSSSSECYDKCSKSLSYGTQTVNVKTCYRSKSMSDSSDSKNDSTHEYCESSEIITQKLELSNKPSILQEHICGPISELNKEDMEEFTETILKSESDIVAEKCIEASNVKKDTPIVNEVNQDFEDPQKVSYDEKYECHDSDDDNDDDKNLSQTIYRNNNNNSQLLTEDLKLQEQTTVDNSKMACESKTETTNSLCDFKNCDEKEVTVNHEKTFEPIKEDVLIVSCSEQINENQLQENILITGNEQNILIIEDHQNSDSYSEDHQNSNSYSSHNVVTDNEQTSGISSKYSNTSSAAGNISTDSKSDETCYYNDTPTSKTADSIYTTSEICSTTPDRVQAVSETSDHISESCSITPVGSSPDSNSSTIPERPETRLGTASSTATGSSSTSTLYQTVSEHSTSTQDMTLSIRSDSGVTCSTVSTPASPGQGSPEKINTDKSVTSCSESIQDCDHLASLEDYVNEESTAKAEIILKAFRDRDKYVQPIKEMISQSTQTSHLNKKAINTSLNEEKYIDMHQYGSEKYSCDIMRVSNNDETMTQSAESEGLSKVSSNCSTSIGSKKITTVLPCKPLLSNILNIQTVKVKNDNNNKTFQKSVWLNRSLQTKNNDLNGTKISIRGLSKTDIQLPETVSSSTETANTKIVSQTAYNWSHVTDHDRSNHNQLLTHNTSIEEAENKTNEPCLSSCIGTGSTYRPLPDAQLIIPRYSALPRSISMLVNTSSGECSSNSNSDSECLSLVDSLEDSVSPYQIKKLSKLVKCDVDKLLSDNKPMKNIQGKPECFFISFGEKKETDIETNTLSVSQTMPIKIKEKLLKRQHALEVKRLQRQKSEERNSNSNKAVASKGKMRKIIRQPKINGKNGCDSSESTRLLTSDIKNLEQYESYIIIDIVDSSIHVQPPRNGCVTQPCITVSIEPEISPFNKPDFEIRKTDENQNNISDKINCSKDRNENTAENSEILNNVINDYLGSKIEINKMLTHKCVAEKGIQTSDNRCEKNEHKVDSESNSNSTSNNKTENLSETHSQVNLDSISPTRDNYLDSTSLNTDIDRLSDTVSSTDEDTISTKTCKSRKVEESSSDKSMQDNETDANELVSLYKIENNEGISSEQEMVDNLREMINKEENKESQGTHTLRYKENGTQDVSESYNEDINKEDKGEININQNRKENMEHKSKKYTIPEQITIKNKQSAKMIETGNNFDAGNNKRQESETGSPVQEDVFLKIPKAVSLSEKEVVSYQTKHNVSANSTQQDSLQDVKINNHSQINEKGKTVMHKSHIPVMKSPISQYKVSREKLDLSNQNESAPEKPSHLPVRKTSNPPSLLQSPPIRRSANILTNKFKQRFEVIPEERSCSLESSTEDQNKISNNKIVSHSSSVNNKNMKNVAHEIITLNNIEGNFKVSQNVVEKNNIYTRNSTKPFAYKPRTEKENNIKIKNLKSVPTRKCKTKSDRIRRDVDSENTVQNEQNRMLTRRKRHIPEESSSSNGDNNMTEHSRKSSANSASRLTRRPIRQPKIDQTEQSFQQIEEIVTLRPDINNCYKGKASLATQAEDPDLLSLSKGWINFYLLKNNQGTSEDSNQEDTQTVIDGKIKSKKCVTQPKTVTVVGGESHRVRQYTVPTRSVCENNTEGVTVLPELIRKKSVQAVDKPITPSPPESDHSTTYLDMPTSRFHLQNHLDGSGDLACSESSSSVSSSSDSDLDHGTSPSLLPPRWPIRQWRGSKPSRQRQRNQCGRTELTQYPPHYPSGGTGNNNSGWTVTLAGTTNCPQPPPHDVEMKLSFPACSRRQPASQSDSGLGEDNNHHNDEIQPSLPQPSRSNTPSQQWSFTVKNSQGGINRGRDDYKSNKLSYECLPDLMYHSGQSRNAKKVIKRRPDTGFPMTSVPAEDMRRTYKGQYSKLWPKVQKVLESKVIICKASGQVSHQVRSVSHLLEDDVDVIHTQTELEVTGLAITPEKKPRVPTMSERDLTRGHTARRKTANTSIYHYNYLGH